MRTRTVLVSSLLASTALASLAQDLGQHPAVLMQRQQADINASTFIVGHPASPTWQVRHANADHPAVQVSRAAQHRSINPNLFLVQPPAHVEWTMGESEVLSAHIAPVGRASIAN